MRSLPTPASGGDPAPVSNVSNGALVAHQIVDLVVGEVLIQDTV